MPPLEQVLVNSPSAVASEILAHDWESTSLGPISGWPESLSSLITTMIACPVPMYLAWGPDLISFFNDSYRPILGYRAETALGQPFKSLWSSVWADIEPLVQDALNGTARSVTDMRLDLSRRGEPEESYWTFSYSPVFDANGKVSGMLCVTGETTDRVLAERHRAEADRRLDLALSAGNSIGVWDWDVTNDLVTSDMRFAALYGVDPAIASKGAPISEFFSGIHPEDIDRVQQEVGRTIATNGRFKSEYRILGNDGTIRWVSAQGSCISDEDGQCIRFPGVSYDITDRVTAELAIKASREEREFVIDLVLKQRALQDPGAIVRLSTEALGRRLGVHRVGFYRLLGSDRMNHSAGWSDGTLQQIVGEQSVQAFGVYAERERAKGRSIIFSDSRYEFDNSLIGYAENGVLSGICVPLLDEGRWAAGIYLHHADVRLWSPAEISFAKEIAGLTWVAIERAEALIRLSQRLDRQQQALSEVSDELVAAEGKRLHAESQLRQLQKMEAVGQLTGGVAHDFNNMLAIIIGGLNLTQRRLDKGDSNVRKYIDGALEGATRAATLTQRLLAFSRQQPLSPETLDANKLLSNLTELLARTIGEQIRLETILSAGLWRALVDPNQLENAIINMAVNSRDAMPDGGRLTIETGNVQVDETYAREVDVASGHYVMIAVSDTGTGMSPETLNRAFDPFFTTKSVGQGTGLGLSQVFGFVRQSGGHIRAYSEVGHGTTFKLYLPRSFESLSQRDATDPSASPSPGQAHEIILVVEDEERVRNFSVEALRELGYTVIHAASSPEALDMIERGQDVTLLFTDVVMPELTGRQLADRARTVRPELKVLFTTGYTRNAVVHNGIIDPGTNFLPKPFSIDLLAEKVRQAIDK